MVGSVEAIQQGVSVFVASVVASVFSSFFFEQGSIEWVIVGFLYIATIWLYKKYELNNRELVIQKAVSAGWILGSIVYFAMPFVIELEEFRLEVMIAMVILVISIITFVVLVTQLRTLKVRV